MRILNAVVLISLFSIATSAQINSLSDPTAPVGQTSGGPNPNPAGAGPLPTQLPQTSPPPTVYDHAYEVRQHIHKYASYATLPLFAAELAIGQSLFDESESDSSSWKRGAHEAIGTGIIGLFT